MRSIGAPVFKAISRKGEVDLTSYATSTHNFSRCRIWHGRHGRSGLHVILALIHGRHDFRFPTQQIIGGYFTTQTGVGECNNAHGWQSFSALVSWALDRRTGFE